MKRAFFAGILGILITSPLMATVGNTNFTPNQNVASSCNVDMLSISSGTALTNAHFSPLTYSCAAGTYLPDGDTWDTDSQYTSGNCKQCTAGNYCAGSGNSTFTYSEASDQGITSCGSTYNHSDAGSDSVDDCYRDCAAADVAHLKSGGTVTGRYYSSGTNECAPADSSQCTTGYHYVAGAPDLNTAIGTVAGSGSGSGTTFSVTYSGKGTITGNAQCSTRSATEPRVGDNWGYVLQSDSTTTTLPDSTGQYCYCQLTEYTPDGGNSQSLSAPWVFNNDNGDADYCASVCANVCAYDLRDGSSSSLAFRAAVFGSLGSPVASCPANTYTVVYNSNKPAGASGSVTGSTASSTHTYDESKALTSNGYSLTGYTFGGWATTDSGTATYTNGQSVSNLSTTNNGTVNLYAVWTPNTYTVTFGTNGATSGTPGTASVTCTYDQDCPAFATQGTMLKTNSVFGGWNTATNGSGTNYAAGASNIKNLSSTNGATVPLYAKWTTCTACSAGTGANCALSVTNNACTYTTTCQAGYYNLTNSGAYNPACSACGAGTYSTADNTAASCTAVGGGYWNDGCGTDAAGGVCNNTYHGGAINAGYFSSGGGQSATPSSSNCTTGNTCGQCTTDSATNRPAYSDAGAASCSPCPIGYTYNTTAGKSAITQCQANCPAGQWNGEYTMLQYIENTGVAGAYIDTLVPGNNDNLRIVTKLRVLDFHGSPYNGTYYDGIAGNYESEAQNATRLLLAAAQADCTTSDSDCNLRLVINLNSRAGGGSISNAIYMELNTDYTLDLSRTGVFANNQPVTLKDNVNQDSANAYKISIFAGATGNHGFYTRSHSRIYYFSLYDGNTMVRNFIPARRNSDNVVGMYDTVTGTFFTNAGTGAFVAGSDVGGIGQCANVAAGYYSAGGVVNFGTTGTRTQCPTEYPSSVSGASANTQCYTACTTANITHSATVSGNDYYGAGTDTCVASACVTGYTPASGGTVCGANTITITWADGDNNPANNPTTQCTYDGALPTPATAPTKRGHTFAGWKIVAP